MRGHCCERMAREVDRVCDHTRHLVQFDAHNGERLEGLFLLRLGRVHGSQVRTDLTAGGR